MGSGEGRQEGICSERGDFCWIFDGYESLHTMCSETAPHLWIQLEEGTDGISGQAAGIIMEGLSLSLFLPPCLFKDTGLSWLKSKTALPWFPWKEWLWALHDQGRTPGWESTFQHRCSSCLQPGDHKPADLRWWQMHCISLGPLAPQ